MKSPLACEGCSGLGLLFARLPLGLTLAFAGYDKVFHIGVNAFATEHVGAVPPYMPAWFGLNYLHAVPFAELTLGTLLVLGLFTRLSGLVASVMLFSFALAITGFVKLNGTPSLQQPTVYLLLALVALFAGPGKISLDALLFGRRNAARVRE